MKCPHCQAENREGANFCEQCGKSLILKCPNCNSELRPTARFCDKCGHSIIEQAPIAAKPISTEPTSFANGRYQVKRKLGEGGKKKVYLVHDTLLDRDVAFYLIKTEKMDEASRTRIKREAQAMGRLGDHPNIVTIFDFGDHEGQPYMTAPLMPDDVEKLIEKAPDHKLPLDKTIEIAKSVCRGLEFAHAKGIIHRDIKPGNVLLSVDDTAKIGDFGLAVAMDVSRLTQEGIIVGTYSYMSPEQAMGGEVTIKADLYSLGAMLYEMVTGRPPFIGDDSYSVMGQHINTPPVSPTWHRADLPPAFESLILLLLEKDPQKRPNSAGDVYKALESIEKGDIKEQIVETQVPAKNPLYRRVVFVGRENELKQLQSAFSEAMSGQGSLIMVVGEPGIGKTAICEQLATYVTLRGGKTLWGHCYEEGSLSLPYLAFIEAMRSYVLDREPEDLKKELGSGATDVARIVSEIREKLKVTPRKAENPEEDRYRLMQAVTSFLANAARVKPMLVILEDLHDADKGTLEMLSYVSKNLANTRLLIIGTYRDVEVDRTHPLSAALAELRRVSSFGRVLLRGLNIDEVRRMLTSITQEEVPMALAEAVHRQTEGNPLFIQEVVRYLVEEGILTRKDGRWSPSTDSTLETSIPEGLRDVIGKRLTLLSVKCNEMLTVASVIGREFRLDVLQKVTGLSDEELFALLDEAKKATVIEERTAVGSVVTYRFAHAFFRQTLYEETIAPRRIRLHLQIGKTLEEIFEKRLEEHAAELAEHFSHSSDTADLEKAVKYGEMAAKKAMDVYAYSEAVRLYDQAIKVQKVLNPDDKEKMCDLLLDLCNALLEVPDVKRIYEIEAPEAFALAESLGDNSRAVRACTAAMFAEINAEAGSVETAKHWAEWAKRADRHAKPDTIERALADWAMANQSVTTDAFSQQKLRLHAFELAHRFDDIFVLTLTGTSLLGGYSAPQHTAERLRIAEELWTAIRPKMRVRSAIATMLWICDTFLAVGQRKQADEVFNALQTLGKNTGNIRVELDSTSLDLVLAVYDGRLRATIDMAERTRTRSDEVGIFSPGTINAFCSLIRALIYLGMPFDIAAWPVPQLIMNLYYPIILAYSRRTEDASKKLEEVLVWRSSIAGANEIPSYVDALVLEASVLIRHHQTAEMMFNRFVGTGICTSGVWCPTCVLRHLGGAAALLDRYDEAREHYKDSFRVCTDMKFRPELALTRFQLAELLLDHYPDEKKEALEHLDFAINEFREMKMQPSLVRALRRKDILKA